jgi:hypothetical protein
MIFIRIDRQQWFFMFIIEKQQLITSFKLVLFVRYASLLFDEIPLRITIFTTTTATSVAPFVRWAMINMKTLFHFILQSLLLSICCDDHVNEYITLFADPPLCCNIIIESRIITTLFSLSLHCSVHHNVTN